MREKVCSFCGSPKSSCGIFLEGETSNICGMCSDICAERVADKRLDARKREEIRLFEMLEELDCLWRDTGGNYHALLTSGRHSNGFINMSGALSHPRILNQLLATSQKRLLDFINQNNVSVLCGQAMGSIHLAGHLTVALAKFLEQDLRMVFTEKEDGGMQMKRFDVSDENVLLVEYVMTTGKTTLASIDAIKSKGGNVVGIYAAANRSGMPALSGIPILDGCSIQIDDWAEEDCPLCKHGSEPVRPKTNWKLLTGKDV